VEGYSSSDGQLFVAAVAVADVVGDADAFRW